jgi:hypothetical protein
MSRAPRGVRLFGWAAFLFGSVFVAVGIWMLVDGLRFRASANRAEGEVIRLEWSNGEGNSRSGALPVVRYEAQGRTVEFRSRVSSRPPAYRVGELVTVLYHPEDPENASVDTFLEQYLLPLVFGGPGLVFSGVGLAFLIIPGALQRRRRNILEYGTAVKAKVIEVRRSSASINHQHPWVLVAEFKDEITGKEYAAASQFIWVNPEPHYPIGSEVTVYYLPDRPEKNTFQLDRLPELL